MPHSIHMRSFASLVSLVPRGVVAPLLARVPSPVPFPILRPILPAVLLLGLLVGLVAGFLVGLGPRGGRRAEAVSEGAPESVRAEPSGLAPRPETAAPSDDASRPATAETPEEATAPAETAAAREILDRSGVHGGLVVHVPCGDGRLTAALGAGGGLLVEGLDADEGNVRAARERIRERGLYGRVTAERLAGARLPYIDGVVNLLVADGPSGVPEGEVLRVLRPGGIACVRKDGKWTRTEKPRPAAIDEWTHYLHDPSNNAVAHDTVVAPPEHLQWVAGPSFTRHHDRMSGVSAVVSAGGRIFTITDEASRASILLPPEWVVIARDAFNGMVLWKRRMGKWHTHLWPLKSGPAQLPRRLVAEADRVYVTLSLDGPLTGLDAATGDTVRDYDGTKGTEEILVSRGVAFLLVDPEAEEPEFANPKKIQEAYGGRYWNERPRRILALRAEGGELLWSETRRVLPVTLAVDGRRVYFHDGESVVALDRETGKERWRSKPVSRADIIRAFYAPTLVVHEDVVLFSGGETAGAQTGSWYTEGNDTMTALSAETGERLWSAYHPPSGYRSPEDLLVVGGLVWTGETTSGRARGVFTGRDPHTGEVKVEFPPDVETYWFHHRCYRGKATSNYLLMARAGTEFIDFRKQHWIPNTWFRGACLYGVMPANGLMYAPQSPCACYLETKLSGFNALAPPRSDAGPGEVPDDLRLERGPAWGEGEGAAATPAVDAWPTYRHDAARSGRTATSVPARVERAWRTALGGRLTSPVVAEGKVFVASVDAHTVHALDAGSGAPAWRYTAGGRVDSPPTVVRGRVIFGSADGSVHCLRAADGALVWRFLAAPRDERLVAYDQVESVWPVHGSVLLEDGALYFVSGRSMFLDGGLRLWRLDPTSGRILSKTALQGRDPTGADDLESHVTWLNMPVGLPDVLSSDGRLVYMRSQPFRLDGTRLPLERFPRGADEDQGAPPATQRIDRAHIFSPTGFLEDSYWHRSYWLYGSTFVSGWCGYYLAGKVAPAGKILVTDDSTVYGFGRKPQYFRWTTPIEHQLFAAAKATPGVAARGDSIIRFPKSPSLDPTSTPLTVSAWVRAERPDGVVLARGGSSHGYALDLDGGRPRFSVRVGGKLSSVVAKESVTGASAPGRDPPPGSAAGGATAGRWAHVAGVLTPGNEVRIYVDGKLAASGPAKDGLIAADPAEALSIGADEGSCVGEYEGPAGFKGLIDEVRVYRRALSEEEISRLASEDGSGGRPVGTAVIDPAGLVLSVSFDGGSAADGSGHENEGQVGGVLFVDGRVGRAAKLTGAIGGVAGFLVDQRWTRDLPIIARALVLAGGTLFVAGPPDLVDEVQALREIDRPETQALLAAEAEALAGRKGALLLAVSASTGDILARLDLESPPVFDGMAAAAGRLYVSRMDGAVECLGAAP